MSNNGNSPKKSKTVENVENYLNNSFNQIDEDILNEIEIDNEIKESIVQAVRHVMDVKTEEIKCEVEQAKEEIKADVKMAKEEVVNTAKPL